MIKKKFACSEKIIKDKFEEEKSIPFGVLFKVKKVSHPNCTHIFLSRSPKFPTLGRN